MRFLHTADWHLGRLLAGHSLLADQRHILDQLVALAAARRPDAVLIAGDLYDRAVPPAEAVALLDAVLGTLVLDLGLPTIVISGNHDSPERLHFGSRLFQSRGLHVFGTVGSAGMVTIGDTHFAGIPFAEPAEVRSAFPEFEGTDYDAALRHLLDRVRPASGRLVAVAHAFVSGGAESDSERVLTVGLAGQVHPAAFEGCAYAALGHLHRPQRIGVARYAGSPLAYSLSEAGQAKSVAWVDLDAPGGVAVETIPLVPRRQVRILEGAFDELMALPASEDYLHFQLTDAGLIPDAANRLRQRFPYLLGLTPRAAREFDGAAPRPALTPAEMFAHFWEFTQGEPAGAAREAVLARVLGGLEEMR